MTIDRRRKDDHIKYALKQYPISRPSAFDDVRIVHHSLSQLKIEAIDLSTVWAGHSHAQPFYINAMTGGSPTGRYFNQQLAILARETGLAMASGSVSIALKDSNAADSFSIIRQENPHGFIMANLGAHHDLSNARRAVDLLEADALQIHLNVPQEIVMPEGDRDFSGTLDNIQAIVDALDVPVIIKEVGFGMSKETIEALLQRGVQSIDLSGRGGTNFAQIENDRRPNKDFTDLLDWGQTTVESLLEAQAVEANFEYLASGGVRSSLDIFKALVLGAKGVGMAGQVLYQLKEFGLDKSIEWIRKIQDQLALFYLMVGAKKTTDLSKVDYILTGPSREWKECRGL